MIFGCYGLFEVLNSYNFFSIMVLKVARKSIGERVKRNNVDCEIKPVSKNTLMIAP